MDFALSANQESIRDAVAKICARFDDAYWPGSLMQITSLRPSFRGASRMRTRNLEIPGLVLRTIPE